MKAMHGEQKDPTPGDLLLITARVEVEFKPEEPLCGHHIIKPVEGSIATSNRWGATGTDTVVM